MVLFKPKGGLKDVKEQPNVRSRERNIPGGYNSMCMRQERLLEDLHFPFLHSFSKHLLKSCYVLNTDLAVGDLVMNRTDTAYL